MTEKEYLKGLFTKAIEDFKKVKKIVENHKGSIDELYKLMDGFDLTRKHFFQANYGVINVFIYYDFKNKTIDLCEYIRVWNDDELEYIKIDNDEEINVKDIRKYL